MKDLVFKPQVIADLAWWIQQDRKKALRILDLINDISRDPFRGKGKPEPLKHQYTHCWSRRIDKQNRLIYQVLDTQIAITKCQGHYE